MGCRLLPNLYEVYFNYLRKTFEQYQEQSQKTLQRAQSTAEEVADATELRTHRAWH
jgi:glutamate/tyrosine decarboxylase-like PLP-dependent enzyme